MGRKEAGCKGQGGGKVVNDWRLVAWRAFVQGVDCEDDHQSDQADGPGREAYGTDVTGKRCSGFVTHSGDEAADPNQNALDNRQSEGEDQQCLGGEAESHQQYRRWAARRPIARREASRHRPQRGLLHGSCLAKCGKRRAYVRHRFRPVAPMMSMQCNDLGRIIRIVRIIGRFAHRW